MDDPSFFAPNADAAPKHGGSLAAACALFPGAPEPWVDLSTGINPRPYPMPPLGPEVFARLPEPDDLARLAAVAAAAYRTGADCVVAAPGTQALLPLVAALVPPGRAVVLGPTYAEHARAAALAGHAALEARHLGALAGADLAVVVNPNNPDGRVCSRRDLLALAAEVRLLVVDEAFAEAAVGNDSVAGDVAGRPLVVLRSFGKFYGLAGVRLGFALADPALARRIEAALGPWPVSGPALAAGLGALADAPWREVTRARLAAEAARLDALLAAAGLGPAAGTLLFRFVRSSRAGAAFERLGHAGVYTRRFAHDPAALRFGLPGSEAAFARLAAALGA